MLRLGSILTAAMVIATLAFAQNPPPQFPNMTFFIASTPGPDGANYGGLDGAD